MNPIYQKCINSIRILSMDAIEKANSGHPGLPLGAAPAAFTLWADFLKHSPNNPKWQDRDRFVLSAGHGSMLMYSLLHLFGYGVDIEDIKQFRQWKSKTPGHPEYNHTEGVETTTGPLGQGFANGVGLALAEANLASKFNKPGFNIVDHYTYALCGDGCMMEGITSEAASFAGSMGLGKLIVLYDSNSISIEGSTNITFRENVAARFEAYGWQTIIVEDGNDPEEISNAIKLAKSDLSKPSLVEIKTIIGYGCPAKQGKSSIHGEPCGKDNIQAAREFLGWDSNEPFLIPDDVKKYMETLISDGNRKEADWKGMFELYSKQYPELAKEWRDWNNNVISPDYKSLYCDSTFIPKAQSTRAASGAIINSITSYVPNLIGGSADLSPSTKTAMKDRSDFSSENPIGSNLHFGVREHAMAAIGNGIAIHGGLRPYVSTFMVFCDYMKGAMRLSAIMKLPIIYILTHDSIGVGEDGPTHQPIEHLASLRSIPGLTVFRPADIKETQAAWNYALTNMKGPTVLILSRQDLPTLDSTSSNASKGGYIIFASEKEPELILIGSGSETQLVYEAGKKLDSEGLPVRVVSMPSWEAFDSQQPEYQQQILPNHIRRRIAVEAGSSFGWHKYIGFDGDIISIDTFGASGPAEILFKEFGFTVDNIISKAKKLVQRS
ncbi:MAG: transketolase [Bacillota bacterium]|nr:transketolase [Bacillota bacterium]